MNSKAPNRQHDEEKIPNGRYFEPYSPAAGQITSSALLMPDGVTKRKLLYARVCMSAANTLTFKDGKGNAVVAFPLSAGEHFFLVTEVSAIGGGSVALIHDGEIDQTQDQPTP